MYDAQFAQSPQSHVPQYHTTISSEQNNDATMQNNNFYPPLNYDDIHKFDEHLNQPSPMLSGSDYYNDSEFFGDVSRSDFPDRLTDYSSFMQV